LAYREKLREQHALGEEIAQAITSAPIGDPIDESELDDELADLEQEQLDNQMLKTGTVPVSDDVHRLPAVSNGESKSSTSQRQSACARRGGRRRGRTPEATSRDGYVTAHFKHFLSFGD
jgi:hypothetical protein